MNNNNFIFSLRTPPLSLFVMKTNYTQQLAWFENTVKPHVLRQHSSSPIYLQTSFQVNYDFAGRSRSDQEGNRWGLQRSSAYIDLKKLDLQQDTTIIKKRARMEEELEEQSPFINTMEDDLENEQSRIQQIQQSPISIPDSEIFMFVNECHSE